LTIVKVYLDVCCLSRLTDDQGQPRIREEAEAVEKILARVRAGVIDLISSEALADEAKRNPSLDRRLEVEALLAFGAISVAVDETLLLRARELAAFGYGPYDALHVASAEGGEADVLLTTDDRLLSRAARGIGNPRIPIRNPLSWMKEQGP
jgi:predicted nucleic acid-binding protein